MIAIADSRPRTTLEVILALIDDFNTITEHYCIG